jgi:hypothetical protein
VVQKVKPSVGRCLLTFRPIISLRTKPIYFNLLVFIMVVDSRLITAHSSSSFFSSLRLLSHRCSCSLAGSDLPDPATVPPPTRPAQNHCYLSFAHPQISRLQISTPAPACLLPVTTPPQHAAAAGRCSAYGRSGRRATKS